MTAAVWLAPDAPRALAADGPLAKVARPAGGRQLRRHVSFAVVPRAFATMGATGLARLIEEAVGPTRVGEVVVQPAFDHEHAALYLASPRLAHLPVARLNEALAALGSAPPGCVLLIAHCLVLWRQHASLAVLS